MEEQAMRAMLRSEGAYKVATLADVIEVAYVRGSVPSFSDFMPMLGEHQSVVERLMRCAYTHGLRPRDRHFDELQYPCSGPLVTYATSKALANLHGRQLYPINYRLHVRDQAPLARARLLAAAYKRGDFRPDVAEHIGPLLPYQGWRALLAAYKHGTRPRRWHLDMADTSLPSEIRPAERSAAAAVMLVWIKAGVCDSMSSLPLAWLTSDAQRHSVLLAAYKSGIVPQLSHVREFGPVCSETVRTYALQYLRHAMLQRTCLRKRLHEDIVQVLLDCIRAREKV
jgi:hypothetical protein